MILPLIIDTMRNICYWLRSIKLSQHTLAYKARVCHYCGINPTTRSRADPLQPNSAMFNAAFLSAWSSWPQLQHTNSLWVFRPSLFNMSTFMTALGSYRLAVPKRQVRPEAQCHSVLEYVRRRYLGNIFASHARKRRVQKHCGYW